VRQVAYIAVWIFIATVPLDRLFIGQIVGADIPITITQVVGVVTLLVATIATLFEAKLRRFDRAHAFVFLFILWSCLSGLWSIDPESSIQRVFTYVQLGLMVWLLCQYGQDRSEQIGFMLAYVCGAGFVVSQLFLGYLLGGTVLSYEIFPGRYTSMGYNPNDLALTLAIGIPFAWFVFRNNRGLAGLISVAYIPAAFAGILLSASRGGMFAAVVAALILPIGFIGISHGRKLVILAISVAAVAIALVVVPERSWERLKTVDDSATTEWSVENLENLETVNTRVAIWKEGLEMFNQRPFLGVGVGGYLNVVDPVEGERRVAHNVLLSILVEVGLVGLVFFIAMIIVLTATTRHMASDERLMWLIVIATFLVGGFFLSWEHTKQTWLLMGLLAARAVPLRAPLRRPKPDVPDETKALVARHQERQRWDRTRELAIQLLLNQDELDDSDPVGLLLFRLVAASEDWTDVEELIGYLQYKLNGSIPDTIAQWRVLAEQWAEELRRMLVSDF
jgi:O-antigen ligase